MSEPRAQRTLVKSPPELWAEVSDVSTLARHLGEFGEIRITRLEAETTVVWEGDRARGTVELEASGWGTKVTITAEAIATDDAEVVVVEAEVEEIAEVEVVEVEETREAEAEPVEEEPVEAEVVAEAVAIEPEAVVEPETMIEPEPEAAAPAPAEPRRGFFARFRRRRAEPVVLAIEPPAEPEPEPVAVEPEPEPVAVDPEPEPVAVEPEPEIVPTVAAPEPVAEAAEITEPDLAGEITAADTTAATVALAPEQVEAVLVGVLDDLGSAHHRPFSRG